jgi:hypothetical protein
MRRTMLRCLGLVLVLPLMAQAQPESGGFDFAGVRFALPIPKGYCLPQGAAAEGMRRLAEIDTRNVAHFALTTCGDERMEGDHIRILTSRSMLDAVVTRETLLANMKPLFATPGALDTARTLDQASDALTQSLGTRVDLRGKLGPIGMDSVCAFMGGFATVTMGDSSYVQSVAACMTTVGDRVLQIYSTGPGEKPEDLERRMRLVEAIALSIRTQPMP